MSALFFSPKKSAAELINLEAVLMLENRQQTNRVKIRAMIQRMIAQFL